LHQQQPEVKNKIKEWTCIFSSSFFWRFPQKLPLVSHVYRLRGGFYKKTHTNERYSGEREKKRQKDDYFLMFPFPSSSLRRRFVLMLVRVRSKNIKGGGKNKKMK
jgi:hypothetical protein